MTIVLMSINSYSQKDSIVNYLGRKFEKVDKKEAWYTQTIVNKGTVWEAIVYYPNGKPKFEGRFKEMKLKTRLGVFKKFNEKGSLKSIENYNSDGKKEGIYLYFNDEGEQITNGLFTNGKRNGVWKYYDDYKKIRARIVYNQDKIITYKLWNEKGEVLNEELILSRKPNFEGGFEAFKEKLNNELIGKLKKKGLTTNFLVRCTVTEKGQVENLTVLPSLKEDYRKEIETFFYSLENIEPAILTNRKVSYQIDLPIIVN